MLPAASGCLNEAPYGWAQRPSSLNRLERISNWTQSRCGPTAGNVARVVLFKQAEHASLRLTPVAVGGAVDPSRLHWCASAPTGHAAQCSEAPSLNAPTISDMDPTLKNAPRTGGLSSRWHLAVVFLPEPRCAQ